MTLISHAIASSALTGRLAATTAERVRKLRNSGRKELWWYMFLYRRYLEGGMPLVQEYQGFAKEALTALNARPEYATPATP